MQDHRSAAMARRKLLPGKTPLWDNVDVQVDWAQPENNLDDTVMEKVSNLYVRNIAPHVSEGDIAQLFIRSCRVSITKVKKIKDFAFVHFKERSMAEEVLEFTRRNPRFGQGLSADGNYLGVMWAKPPDQRPRRGSSGRWEGRQDGSPPYRQNSGLGRQSDYSHRGVWSNGYCDNQPLRKSLLSMIQT